MNNGQRKRLLGLVVIALLGTCAPGAGAAQGALGLPVPLTLSLGLGTTAGVNRDRPSFGTSFLVAPGLRLGSGTQVRILAGGNRSWLQRAQNPHDFLDTVVEVAHYQPLLALSEGTTLALRLRGYLRTSNASELSGLRGQVRGYVGLSQRLGPLGLGMEANAQKYVHKHTSWSTHEEPGTSLWYRQAGREEYLENNVSHGLGQSVFVSLSPMSGVSLALRWSMVQSRQYQPREDHAEQWGSTLLEDPRQTGWVYGFGFNSEVVFAPVRTEEIQGEGGGGGGSSLGADGVATRAAVSSHPSARRPRPTVAMGYDILAPQLQHGGRIVSLNPFNPLFGMVYLNTTVAF